MYSQTMTGAERHPEAVARPPHIPQGILEAAQTLSVDLLTAEVTATMRTREIRFILLKGPAIAAWLYRGAGFRPYGDCDLLLSPEQMPAAQEMLLEMGF